MAQVHYALGLMERPSDMWKGEEEPAFVMQFAMQQHRVLSPSLFTLRPQLQHHPARSSLVIKPVLPTSQFLAPGLESLQLLPSLRHDCKPFPLGSARAQAGAYQKDAFVEGTEATKIAQVRGSPFLDYHNILL